MISNACMSIAKAVAHISSRCLRRKVGAVILKDGKVIAAGYNGPGKGIEPCLVCPREQLQSGEKLNECLATHAEQQCIATAACAGVSTAGAVIVVTHRPCSMCMKLIIAAGIKEVYFSYDYPDKQTFPLANAAGVKLIKLEDEE